MGFPTSFFIPTPVSLKKIIEDSMCARFSLTSPIDAIRQLFGFTERPNLMPSYNVAPGTPIAAIRQNKESQKKETHLFFPNWGLIPAWAKDRSISNKLINARSETVDQKPSFRHAFKQQRCLIPSNGYYEWQKLEGGGKQPYLIYPNDKSLFAFAGLWEQWRDDQQQLVESCTILTEPATPDLASLHHRIPVTVIPEFYDQWLEGNDRSSLPRANQQISFSFHPVSKKVGNVQNNTADLIDEITPEKIPEQRRDRKSVV